MLAVQGAGVLRRSVASKTVVGILIGCAAIAMAGVVIIIAGGWYVKQKVEEKVHSMNSQSSVELWSDVPRMDDLKRSNMDIPVTIKLIAQPILNRVIGEGTHSGDWIIFTTKKTPDDIKNFYTNSRMTSSGGWDASDNSTCLTGSSQGISQVGLFCVFQKNSNNKQVGLMILTGPHDQTTAMNVFFLRVEAPGTTVANKPGVRADGKQAARGITTLNGTAPYGIEKRPMPAGLNLDELLPKQVGPYTRTMLEMSSKRGVQPSSIEVDGNSVYATYRSGSAEIFVEFSVSSSAANAQTGLDVAASEVTDQFPTDPRFGSLGTEPSYLKVNNESGAFFAWTRGGYYFSANAKSGEAALDAFMQAFPY